MPKMFRTSIASEADVKVYETDIRSEADLVCHVTGDSWSATTAPVWAFTDIRGEADKVVCFVSSRWEADLIVFMTDLQHEAGWNDAGKAHLLA